MSRVRDLGRAAIKNTRSALPSGERALAELLLELYEEPGGTGWQWGISRGASNSYHGLLTRNWSVPRTERLMLPFFAKSDCRTFSGKPSEKDTDGGQKDFVQRVESGSSSTEVRLVGCSQITTWPSNRYLGGDG